MLDSKEVMQRKPMQGLADWLRALAETQAADIEQEERMRQWACEVEAALQQQETREPVAGWKLVPVEPTEEMAYRGGEATAGKIEWDDAPDDAPDRLARAIYRAMIAASPIPQQECQHELVSMRNEVVKSGLICSKCFALFPESAMRAGQEGEARDAEGVALPNGGLEHD